MSRSSQAARRGFTLVELLLVITIEDLEVFGRLIDASRGKDQLLMQAAGVLADQ